LFLKASETRQKDFQSVLLLSQSLRVLGDSKSSDYALEGLNKARKQLELNPANRRALSLGCGNLYEIGEKEEAFQWANKALELYPDDAGVLINTGCLFARDGQKEKALDILEKAFGKGFWKKEWIEHDPYYDKLRNEPRFIALLGKLQ
jgi:tetratricopeptide (TPR) repeat protein